MANESYGYGDSLKGSPEVVHASSETGYTLSRLYHVPVGIRGSRLVKTTSKASGWSE